MSTAEIIRMMNLRRYLINTLEAIRARKSVRSYQDKPVESEKIKAIVEAGNMAAMTPMAGKTYFNVISNPALLNQIKEGTRTVMQNSGVDMLVKISSNPAFNPIYGAPVCGCRIRRSGC